MKYIPKSLASAIEAIGKLPGVGPRSAERYAYFLFKQDPRIARQISDSLNSLHQGAKVCPKTFALIDANQEVSPLYDDAARDRQIVAVVAEPFDIFALEKAGVFKGTYHVLGGLLSPLDGVDEDALNITALVQRIAEDQVQEIILATNATVEGESTAMQVQKRVLEQHPKITVTRLARGLPMGTDLEFTDHITLGRAFEGRQQF